MATRASYGVDAPPVLFGLTAAGVILMMVAIVNGVIGAGVFAVIAPLVSALYFLASAGLFLYATRRGKLAVLDELLDGLGLRGDERVLDLGCGRGAVLITAARRVPAGHVDGIDLWRSVDQSGNRIETTRANAEAEGVADRVTLHTGDVTATLPFPDASFDLVVSSLVIHNIHDEGRRRNAVGEAYRVLRPGGRILLVDLKHTAAYADRLTGLGATEVTERGLGWRFWFGGPWVAARATQATRPPAGPGL
jgi:arsenite methyltransferase